jgi:hypothetical protein
MTAISSTGLINDEIMHQINAEKMSVFSILGQNVRSSLTKIE